MRHLLGHDLLAPDRGVCGATAYCKVIAADNYRPVLDAAATDHEIRRQKIRDFALLVIGCLARDRADFVEASGIQQFLNSLANGELSRIVLALDFVRAPHLEGKRFAPLQFLEFRLPAHPPIPVALDKAAT